MFMDMIKIGRDSLITFIVMRKKLAWDFEMSKNTLVTYLQS